MTDQATPTNRCYRHPDRESFVRCQRCGRTVCPQCQTQAAVGVHCPECVREARASSPRSRPLARRVRSLVAPGSGRPVVTYSIIAISIVTFLLEALTGNNFISGDANGPVANRLTYFPGDIAVAPWTIITVNFVHADALHILFNMYSLFILGPLLEGYLGRARFTALFFLSGIGGVVAVDYFSHNSVVGASGAIFGLFGALIVFARRIGIRSTQLWVLVVINLAIGFVVPGIAWQAHIGGLLTGAAIGFLFLRTGAIRRRPIQVASLAALLVVFLGALLVHLL